MPRADRAYIRSLLTLYASPAPGTGCADKTLPVTVPREQKCALGWGKRAKAKRAESAPAAVPKYVWRVPPGTLSNAGRLVVLRGGNEGARDEDIRAEITCDEEMRGVVFGDPVMRKWFLGFFAAFCGL